MRDAKAAYNRYHAEMGTTDAPAFERLSNREQAAWNAAAEGTCSTSCYDRAMEVQRLCTRLEELKIQLLRRPEPKKRGRKKVGSV